MINFVIGDKNEHFFIGEKDGNYELVNSIKEARPFACEKDATSYRNSINASKLFSRPNHVEEFCKKFDKLQLGEIREAFVVYEVRLTKV